MTDIDVMQRPEVEYDDSADTLTAYWRAPHNGPMFSLVIQDGCLIGVMSGTQRDKPWKIELPKGLVRIDCSVMTAKKTDEQSDKGAN
jgi:hypothetical protein